MMTLKLFLDLSSVFGQDYLVCLIESAFVRHTQGISEVQNYSYDTKKFAECGEAWSNYCL